MAAEQLWGAQQAFNCLPLSSAYGISIWFNFYRNILLTLPTGVIFLLPEQVPTIGMVYQLMAPHLFQSAPILTTSNQYISNPINARCKYYIGWCAKRNRSSANTRYNLLYFYQPELPIILLLLP